MGGIDSSRLDLDAENAPAFQVKHRQLRRLEVGERAEETEIAALGQQTNHLGFAQESDVASPHRVRLDFGSDGFRWCDAEPLDQAVRWNQERIEPASVARMPAEVGRVNGTVAGVGELGQAVEL